MLGESAEAWQVGGGSGGCDPLRQSVALQLGDHVGERAHVIDKCRQFLLVSKATPRPTRTDEVFGKGRVTPTHAVSQLLVCSTRAFAPGFPIGSARKIQLHVR